MFFNCLVGPIIAARPKFQTGAPGASLWGM